MRHDSPERHRSLGSHQPSEIWSNDQFVLDGNRICFQSKVLAMTFSMICTFLDQPCFKCDPGGNWSVPDVDAGESGRHPCDAETALSAAHAAARAQPITSEFQSWVGS